MRCFVEKSRFLGTPPFKNQFLIGVSLKTAYQCVVTLFIIIINNKKGIVYIKNIIYICFIDWIIHSLIATVNYYIMKQNIIIVGNNYQDFVEKAKEVTKGYQTVWYERILFNEKFKFSKCKIDTQVIVLRRIRSRNDIPRWFKLSKYSITVEKRGYPLYLVYPKMVFNCPPNLFKLLPRRITANCKVIFINNETN